MRDREARAPDPFAAAIADAQADATQALADAAAAQADATSALAQAMKQGVYYQAGIATGGGTYATGALGFTPKFMISICWFGTSPPAIGFSTGTGSLAQSVQIKNSPVYDADAILTETADVDVTAWSSSGVTITNNHVSATANVLLLIVGY